MFKHAITIFRVYGIEIRIDPSWLLIAGLFVWNLSSQYFPYVWPEQAPAVYILLGVVAMLGFFGSLLLHELAHSLVALAYRLQITSITLFIFGGVAGLASEPRSARSEFWIAIAGPAMSFALAGAGYLLAAIGQGAGLPTGVVAVFAYLGLANLVLAIFNLVPAFPMDGGRVLRAAIWYLKNDLHFATLLASRIGNLIGAAMMALGLLSAITGGGFGGFWLILIGFFVLSSSRSVYQMQLMDRAVTGLQVSNLMTTAPVTAEPWMTLEDLAREVMLARHVSFVPVVSRGRVLGYIDRQALRGIAREDWPATPVERVMVAANRDNTLAPDTAVAEVIERMQRSGQRKFLVVQGRELVGVLSATDLLAYVSLKQDLNL